MTELETIKRKILLKEQALFLIDNEEEETHSKIHANIENLWQQYRRLYKQQCLNQIDDSRIMNPIAILGGISEQHGV